MDRPATAGISVPPGIDRGVDDELEVRLQVSFRRALAMGPGKAALIAVIGRTGTISGAARELEMPFRRAWTLMGELNTMFARPVISTSTGGAGGGGATVTAFGLQVLEQFEAMDHAVNLALDADMRAFARLLRVGDTDVGDTDA